MKILTPFQKEYGSVRLSASKGQSIIEYAGMIVLSTIMVAGIMSSTRQIMPVLFTALSQRNASALSDAPPLPAADFPQASATDNSQLNSQSNNAVQAVSQSLQHILPTETNVQTVPVVALTDAQQEQEPLPKPLPLSEARSIKPTPGFVTDLEPHPAAEPLMAPPPRIAMGPKVAQPEKIASDPSPGLQPRLAPTALPAPEARVISQPIPFN